MPVKVRCSGCEKVLNAPDKARGKSLKCPHCSERVRVPARKKSGATGAKKKKRTRRPADDGDFLGGMNLDRMEDESADVCQKCGATVYEDDEVCKACGINLATGKTHVKRKGPDPSRFYGEAWSGSWSFMLKNMKLAFFTGSVWTLFFVLYVGGAAATGALHTWETGRAIEADKVQREKDSKVGAKPGEEKQVQAPMTRGQAAIKAVTTPPVLAMGFVTVLMVMGGLGWGWNVSAKVIEQTMRKKKQLEMRKVQFDFFQNVILGFKAFFWPIVVLMPVFAVALLAIVPMIIASALVFGSMGPLGITLIALGLYTIPIFVFPVAQVHMTMPYTYPAFLPWDMLRLFFRNIGPALYWLVMYIVVVSPLLVICGILMWQFGSDLIPTIAGKLIDMTAWAVKTIGEDPEKRDAFTFKALWLCVAGLSLSIGTALVMIPLSFPALFLMRANGLLGYYNRRTLDLVTRQKPNIPCGFWVRYLAMMIDGLLILLAMVVLSIVFQLATFIINSIGYDFTLKAQAYAFLGIFVLMPMYYYTKSEAGIFQGTLGKRSLGIKVVNMKDEPISLKQAYGRFWGKFISTIILGGGYVMAGLTENKQALHDQMAKAKVVWEGDDERS
ncbi:MAG: hypothetical protein HON53_23020 [Planctomycetaceae bacterium]|jgi:uncharacterized RDD family membrane protein YckC|nr:hypothetical protein [Planctomycetaceae bacterium]MBT6153055.1 hypothetical protein [Planctomycetaceae bacterium]MBT6487958.1 hypothetical protein [Planctomycetaceae bacterium]